MSDYSTWKVVELREELARRGLETKGLKVDLVKRLSEETTEQGLPENPPERENLLPPSNFSETDVSSSQSDVLSSTRPSNEAHTNPIESKGVTGVEDEPIDHETDGEEKLHIGFTPDSPLGLEVELEETPLNGENKESLGPESTVLVENAAYRVHLVDIIETFGPIVPGSLQSHRQSANMVSFVATFKSESGALKCVDEFALKFPAIHMDGQTKISIIPGETVESLISTWNQVDESIPMQFTQALPSLPFRPVRLP